MPFCGNDEVLDKPHRPCSEGHSCVTTRLQQPFRRWIEVQGARSSPLQRATANWGRPHLPCGRLVGGLVLAALRKGAAVVALWLQTSLHCLGEARSATVRRGPPHPAAAPPRRRSWACHTCCTPSALRS